MANRRIEDQLDALSSLRGSSPAVAAPALRKALNDRVNLVAAKAANVAAAGEPEAMHRPAATKALETWKSPGSGSRTS